MARIFIASVLSLCAGAGASVEPPHFLEGLDDSDPTLLLQTGLHRKAVQAMEANRSTPDAGTLPMAWLHIPKCGSSLLYAIVQTPEVCPELAGAEEVVFDFVRPLWYDIQAYPQANGCPNLLQLHKNDCAFPDTHGCTHPSVTNYAQDWKGRGVTMFREPGSRVTSAWKMVSGGTLGPRFVPECSFQEYAENAKGCYAKMLVRSELNSWDACDGDPSNQERSSEKVTDAELAIARQRVQEFAFVGLTEEWQLSMCLWSRMFDMQCTENMFWTLDHVSREEPSESPSSADPMPEEDYDLSEWNDAADEAVYADAAALFNARLLQYGLNHTTCMPCYEQAKLDVSDFLD